MGVVDEGEQCVGLIVGGEAPALSVGVEIKANLSAVGLAGDGIAGGIAIDEVTAIVAVDHRTTLSHGVTAAPEFDAVEHDYVGKHRNFIDGENTAGEEHEFVDKLIVDLLVPRQELVAEGETAYTGCGEEAASGKSDHGYGKILSFHLKKYTNS